MANKASKTTRTEIAIEADSIPLGQTHTIVCPECGGGTSRAATLSITKKDSGQVAFICFRDSCQIKGYLKASGTPPVKVEKVKKPREVRVEKLIAEPHEEVPTPTELYVQEKYSISLKENYCRWDPKTERVLIPIFDEVFQMRGYIARSYQGAEPKALTYKQEGYEGAAWFQVGFVPTDTLVVVEDAISAIAVLRMGIDAVALLGTFLSDATIEQILNCKYKSVLVALDADAFARGIENTQKLKGAKMLPLQKDIKDMTLKERAALLEIKENDVN